MYGIDPDPAFSVLCAWFLQNARDLPWRADRDPYHVWISEIMLQQTRAEAVKAYYVRFLEALPDIPSLASCSDAQLLKLWEGLGYYSRARNLKKAAGTILSDYGGRFPDTYESILSLSGIGPYTAGAIASISFGRPVPAVDGNVLRVLSRLSDDESDITDPAVKKAASALIGAWLKEHPDTDPGIFNQALMELGAIVCVPNGPAHCETCPWNPFCAAKKAGTILRRPVKKKAKARRKEQRTILLITDGEKLLLHKRPPRGLLASMTEPVNLKGYFAAEEIAPIVREMGLSPVRVITAPEAKHIFTHLEWEMRGYLVRIEEAGDIALRDEMFFAGWEEIGEKHAVPGAFKVYMEWMAGRMD